LAAEHHQNLIAQTKPPETVNISECLLLPKWVEFQVHSLFAAIPVPWANREIIHNGEARLGEESGWFL